MDDQPADEVVKNMEKESETSDSASTKPNKLFVKLKFSKTLIHWSQHICSVCSKGFISGKALGGHMRIHMKGSKNGRHRKISKLHPSNIAKSQKRISKNVILPKATDGAFSDQDKEKVSCCICNKDFRSMKSLFGHMRNHPERGWRGIRPPPSEKKSRSSSVSKNDKALEVDQISCATEKGLVSGSDPVKSLQKWTNTAKRCGKFTSDDNEIPEAAYCLLKLARGNSFDLGQSSAGYQIKYPQTDKLTMDYKTRSLGLVNKASAEEKRGSVLDKEMGEGKGKATLKTESDQERVPSECKLGDSYSPGEGKKMGKLFAKELNCSKFIDSKTMEWENKMKVNYVDNKIIENNRWFDQFQEFPMKPDKEEGDPLTMEGRYRIFPSSKTMEWENKMKVNYADNNKIIENNRWFDQFQKFPVKPDEEEGDPLTMEGRCRIFPSSQTPGSYPKNSGGGLFQAPLNETAASPAEGKHLHSKTLLFPKTACQATEGSQVCTRKILDFDLNEPYVALDGEATAYRNSDQPINQVM